MPIPIVSALKRGLSGSTFDPTSVLSALGSAVVAVDRQNVIRYANGAAEQLFACGAAYMVGQSVTDFLPPDSPLLALVTQARDGNFSVAEYGVTLDTPRTGHRTVTVQIAPIIEMPGAVVISLHEQSIALKIGSQLTSRNAARSVSAMAAILAHEVKNPLSGIRGAAQLLEQNAGEDDRVLTRLICDEADRIVALVDRMEAFSDNPTVERSAVNIHRVLEHVRRISEAGFARSVRIIENYDPSLPPVLGDRDQLVQVFLNLVKNAAEAVPEEGGEIILSTGYQHGVRLALPGSETRRHLPLVVSIQDNGPGIPEDLKPNLFDAFVTTKTSGSGLGLALVAKIIGDHGGVIEFDSVPRRTIFRVMLPMVQDGDGK
ncbi:Nitrogen regulation protein NtrB [Paramagnetospirillum magnetotacticum MS-1]|uniref:histidine kinase n=1 Tax=Paramagnetospirillum magnetotacticum MS-1 TaxID=272627 RepID=A0A0C2YGB0_PARME|nr:ATP-binding protein [Paramagnetospirillum magnetotacticum]KIL98809.1 Nitrogen regulation protein NtrB [Paramagnetospirillum magnetotacticum MS-1]